MKTSSIVQNSNATGNNQSATLWSSKDNSYSIFISIFGITEKNVRDLSGIYNTRWSVHLTHPSFLSQSELRLANFPAGYGHTRLIADLSVLYSSEANQFGISNCQNSITGKKGQYTSKKNIFEMKKFQLQYYILRLDLNISFVISLKLLYTTKVGYLCHCLHLHTVLLHIFVCITVKIYAIKLRSMVAVGGSKNLE